MSVPRVRMDLGGGLTDCALPYNWKDIKFEAIFTNEFPSASLDAILFEIRGQDAININNYLATSPYAWSEGIPYEIAFGNPLVSFPVILNTGDASAQFEPEIVKLPIKRVASIDWFNDTMKSVTFTLLHDLGIVGLPGSGAKWTYKEIPYTVTLTEDGIQAIMLVLQEYALWNHLLKAITDTTKSVSKLTTDIVTEASALGIGIIDPGAPIVSTGMLIGDGLTAALDILFDIILGFAIVGNIEMLINFVGTKRYKYAMLARDLINAAIYYVNSLGVVSPFSFASTILNDPASPYYNTIVMPRKSIKEQNNLTTSLLKGGALTKGTEIGVPNTYGYYEYDASRLLSELGTVFNAKGTMLGNVYNFEEVHHFDSGPNSIGLFSLPNVDSPGYNKDWPAPNGNNWSEREWYYRIAFAIDPTDERTTIDYTGTSCSVTIQPASVKTAINLLSPGSKDITFPFALAKRKEYLNAIEIIVDDIWNVTVGPILEILNAIYAGLCDIVIGIEHLFGGKAKFVKIQSAFNPLQSLIGCMEVSSDSWNEQKIFIGVEYASKAYSPFNSASTNVNIAGLTYSGVNIVGINLGGTPDGVEWQIDGNNGRNKNNVYNNPNSGTGTEYTGQGYFSAFAMMQQFHGKNLLSRGNQWNLYKNKRFPMNSTIFNLVLNYNVFVTANGKYGKFDKMGLKIADDMAEDVDYRVNEIYWPLSNLIETISVDGN